MRIRWPSPARPTSPPTSTSHKFTIKHGVVTFALRGKRLTPRKQEALAVMLDGLLSGEERKMRRGRGLAPYRAGGP